MVSIKTKSEGVVAITSKSPECLRQVCLYSYFLCKTAPVVDGMHLVDLGKRETMKSVKKLCIASHLKPPSMMQRKIMFAYAKYEGNKLVCFLGLSVMTMNKTPGSILLDAL